MTLQADLTAALKTCCPTVFTDFAPAGTTAPWVTFQVIGGRSLRWLNGTPSDKRHNVVQVNVWHSSRAAAVALMHQIETALCDAAAPFSARPEGERSDDAEEDIGLYGCRQDFSIHSTR